MSAQYSLEDTQSMFTKMLHFRWVSFNGIQRMCDPQDIFETRVKLKAISRVSEVNVQYMGVQTEGIGFVTDLISNFNKKITA